MSLTPRRVVTLVHGTWAPHAAWTAAGSKLCDLIAARFGDTVLIDRFGWSGGNSHVARLAAGQALAEHLLALAETYPAAQRHVVAHSHGGNVALYALRDPRLAGKVRGVVCLATPFISASVRDMEPMLSLSRRVMALGTMGPALVMSVITLFLALALHLYPGSPLARWADDFAGSRALLYPAAIAGAALFAWLGSQLRSLGLRVIDGPVRTWLQQRQMRFVQLYAHAASRDARVLNLQVERDEARGWLRFLQGQAEEGFRNATARSVLLVAVLLWSAIALLVMLQMPWADLPRRPVFDVFFGALFTIVALFAAFMVLLAVCLLATQVILIAVPLALRGHGLGFGEWDLFANWLVRIEAMERPPGDVRTEKFRIAGGGLRHSGIYEDPRALAEIYGWIAAA